MIVHWCEPGRLSAHLMDQALRDWDDRVLQAAAMMKILLLEGKADPKVLRGPIAHREKLRPYVFRNTAAFDAPIDIEPFQVTEEQRLAGREAIVRTLGTSADYDPDKENLFENIDNGIVADSISWGRDSRRVFSIDRESALVFGNEAYDPFVWDDILMPFPSFMIELADTPFLILAPRHGDRVFKPEDIFQDGMYTLNGILVTHPASVDPSFPPDAFCCRAFLSDPRRNEPYSMPLSMTSSMRKLCATAAKGDTAAYMRFLAQQKDRREMVRDLQATGLPFKIAFSEPVIAPDLDNGTNTIRRLVAGLCLYLAHAPGEIVGERDIRGTTWKRPRTPSSGASGASRNAIQSAQHLFEVRSVHEFNPRTGYVRFTTTDGQEVCAHARRAHMRREAHTPLDAPKTIKVKATWVNRISRSLLPPGSVTVL